MKSSRPQDETPAEAMEAQLRLYNTLTRRKEGFAPIDPKTVRLYVCGPTVYDFAHIGNARPVIVFDVLFRLLRHLYGADHVTYVRNITDVDDKINARAARDFPGLPLNEAIAKVTAATEHQFHEDVAALGALPPTHEPRATQYVDTMRVMIERLIARGVAYVAEDHVLFSPNAMDALPGAPRYGTLAHRSLDEMLAGARVDVAPYKRDPMDFVLWKPSKPNEPGWPSPAGIASPGRPGWHIECSAMSMATLLEPFGGGLQCDDPTRNTFDIHGGGIDLVFPHHENEIAQSCCAFGSNRMANVWMHNGFLQVEGEKMSKSLGNFVTIHELLRTTKFGGREWPGEVLRLAMLRTHYRQPIDWTVKALEEAEATLDRWCDAVGDVETNGEPDSDVLNALTDDLNTPEAVASLHRLGGQASAPERLKTSANLLGLLQQTRSEHQAIALSEAKIDAAEINAIVAVRAQARAARNWAESDRLRDHLAALGVAIKDTKDGATTWEIKR
jgi:cysteinyl-tRNA synthetase